MTQPHHRLKSSMAAELVVNRPWRSQAEPIRRRDLDASRSSRSLQPLPAGIMEALLA